MKIYLRVAIFCSIVGFINALTYLLLRAGFDDNSYADILKVSGFLCFLLYSSLLINDWSEKNKKLGILFHPTIALLAILVTLSFAGFFLESKVVIWVFSACGFVLFFYFLF